MSGKRAPEGGQEEIMRRASEDEAFVRSSEELEQALSKEYRNPEDVSLTKVRGLAHALASTGDTENEPSNAAATFVDHEVRALLARHLALTPEMPNRPVR